MKRRGEESSIKALIVIFFIVFIYLVFSPFSRFISIMPSSVFKFLTVFDYVLGVGIVIFFFTKHSILSFRRIYLALKGSRLAKGFLIMLFIFFLASIFSYMLMRGVSIIWGGLTTLIAGLLLGSFIFYYIRYLNLSTKYSEEKIAMEFEARRKKNFLLFSSFVGLLFILPAAIFLYNISYSMIFLLFSALSWVVFIVGVVNYIRYVKSQKKISR